jgi:hypothetical protein
MVTTPNLTIVIPPVPQTVTAGSWAPLVPRRASRTWDQAQHESTSTPPTPPPPYYVSSSDDFFNASSSSSSSLEALSPVDAIQLLLIATASDEHSSDEFPTSLSRAYCPLDPKFARTKHASDEAISLRRNVFPHVHQVACVPPAYDSSPVDTHVSPFLLFNKKRPGESFPFFSSYILSLLSSQLLILLPLPLDIALLDLPPQRPQYLPTSLPPRLRSLLHQPPNSAARLSDAVRPS